MREQDIQSKIMIAISEHGGTPIRLNSGTAWGGELVDGVIKHPRKIKLCPPGTPDIMVILPDGQMAWVECKTLTGKQRKTQEAFQKMLEGNGHKYYLIRSASDVDKIFK